MRIFFDPDFKEELFSGNLLNFAILDVQPPVDRIFDNSSASAGLFIRNDTDIPLSLIEGVFDIGPQVPTGKYELNLTQCCNPILPGQSRSFDIAIFGIEPGDFGKEFSLVIGALGDREVPPPQTFTDLAAFNDATVEFLKTTIDFESLPHDASSCDATPAFANPLNIQNVIFSDSPCLSTGFNATLNDNALFLNPEKGVIELPKHFAVLLVIEGMGAAGFEVAACDGIGQCAGIGGTGDLAGPVYAGFMSGADIVNIHVKATTGGPLVLSEFVFVP